MWNRARTAVSSTFCCFFQKIPKVLRTWQFSNILTCKSSFPYSFVHILPTSSFKSAPNVAVSFNILKCKSSSCYSLGHILPTSFSKSAPKVMVFLHVQVQASVLPNPRKQRPSFSDHGRHFTKNAGFRAREFFQTSEFTRSRTATLPNYLMMVGWHDDVVDMIENASHDNRP